MRGGVHWFCNARKKDAGTISVGKKETEGRGVCTGYQQPPPTNGPVVPELNEIWVFLSEN